MYSYTLYKQDGSIEELGEFEKRFNLDQLYKALNCSIVEIIPRDYYDVKEHGRATMWGDEEGRFNSDNKENPHFKNLGDGFNVVGDILKEKVI